MPKNKVETVMREFKKGKLKSGSGRKVITRKQAVAIALSEQRRIERRRSDANAPRKRKKA